MKSILDKSFRYYSSATHDGDPAAFRRRMEVRKRLAQRRARQECTNVAPLDAKRKAKA